MSFFSLLAVSLPEALASIYIGFLVLGEKSRLQFNKKNILSVSLAILLMVLASFLIRQILPYFAVILIIHFIAYGVIFKFVFNFKWLKSLAISLFALGSLVTIEILYLPYCIKYITDNLNNLYSEDMMRFVCSLPERLIQIGLIITFWKWNVVLVNISRLKFFKNITFLSVGVLLFVEGYFINEILAQLDDVSYIQLLFKVIPILACVVFNILFFMLITKLTKTNRNALLQINLRRI